MELQWLKTRDGKMILQRSEEVISSGPGRSFIWKNIPVVEEVQAMPGERAFFEVGNISFTGKEELLDFATCHGIAEAIMDVLLKTKAPMNIEINVCINSK